MASILNSVRNIFKIEELRDRIVYTLVALVVVRLGSFITIPGVDIDLLRAASSSGASSGTIFGLYDMFVGGAFSNAAIFALGIMPYISASIILQIAGVVLPELQKLQREGEDGRRKINQYTRILTVFLAALQAWGVTIKVAQTTAGQMSVVPEAGIFWTLSSVIILTAGTVALMWVGEQITDRGIGNGISLIIMIGIIARFPNALSQEYALISGGSRNLVVDVVLLVLLTGIIASVILVTQGARRIPVQYAKRQVGRKVYGPVSEVQVVAPHTCRSGPPMLKFPPAVVKLLLLIRTLPPLTSAFAPIADFSEIDSGCVLLLTLLSLM